LLQARTQLEALEHATSKGLDPVASEAVLFGFRRTLVDLAGSTDRLRLLVPSTNNNKGGGAVWAARVRDLEDQLVELRGLDSRISEKFRQLRREHLIVPPSRGDAVLNMGMGNNAMTAAEESGKLDRSGEGASGILATGTATLAALMDQKRRLKTAKTRMLDVLHGMGMDKKIIAKIERRQDSDRIFLMAICTLLILALFAAGWLKRYWKSR